MNISLQSRADTSLLSVFGEKLSSMRTFASNVGGNSHTFYAGALEPGDYYVAIRKSGTTGNFSFSSGFYRVNAPPLVTVTSPSEEGSSDDFATTQLGNPWDMDSLADVDVMGGSTGAAIGTVTGAVTEAGASLGSIGALTAANTTGTFSPQLCSSYGDPWVYLLHGSYRGFTYRIDPTRYRILTAEFGIPQKARDICGGSVARIIWRVAGQLRDIASVARRPAARKGKVYIDYLQNGRDKLLVAPYSARPSPGAPVSTPLEWDEVKEGLDPAAFTIKTAPQRFAREENDPLRVVLEAKPDLMGALAKLAQRV